MNRIEDEQITTADLAGLNEPQQPLRPAHQDESNGPLLSPDVAQDLRSHWDPIQTAFVDDPRIAVKQADELVAAAMKRLAETFAEQRSRMEQQWDRGDQVSTEDLRLALRKYRNFFQRLIAV
ncbi:MAG TPA: hypothetical protein VHW09_27655 [Bryobacteraceae bacterium]|jgi:hypothetical protein|nr:hypothetical protein [Bryobacteraceae bacterium]